MTPPALALGEALRRGAAVPDAEFDQLFPDELRDRSHLHWTPVAVAIRAAELLDPTALPFGSAASPGKAGLVAPTALPFGSAASPGRAGLVAPSPRAIRVLDVGAGVGKLCLIGALVTGAVWWGIEQDPVQLDAAHRAAWALDVTQQTRFVQGDGSRLSWDGFDAFYFYNPFHTVMLAPHASPFVRYATIQATLRRIEHRLAATPPGTRVVTFHGFGGRLPASFTQIAREPVGDGALELFVQG